MQVKKQSVKEAILKYGEIEIIENGFDKASMRQIVKAAGITTGNFYNYFKNKEALFDELVEKDLSLFYDFINGHEDLPKSKEIFSDSDELRNHFSTVINQYLPDFGSGLILLIDHSKGTKYEDYKSDLIIRISSHMSKHLHETSSRKKNLEYVDIMAVQFLTGLTIILKNYKSKKDRTLMLVEHIMFYVAGISNFYVDN